VLDEADLDEPRGAGPAFWRGVSVGASLAAVAAYALVVSFLQTGLGLAIEVLAGSSLGAAVLGACLLLARGLRNGLSRVPRAAGVSLGAAAGALIVLGPGAFASYGGLFHPAALLLLCAQACLLGAAWSALSGEWPSLGEGVRARLGLVVALSIGVDVVALAWIAWDGRDPFPTSYGLHASGPLPLEAADPSVPGRHEVVALAYGAGGSRRRPEFGAAAGVRSGLVDGSRLLPEWNGFDGWVRERYWGFGLDAVPLDARVWMPAEGRGHPLVVIAHGNHAMAEPSELGYAWLGELLASRGMIAVSVDENFLNGHWSGDFRGAEMALRAWLLLEHLKQWREWTASPGHRFEGRADMSRIAIVGHSRGGEAAAIATAFNRLSRFPDDASVRFDYGFDIRAVVALAQIDRRYPRRVALEDVDFLALHGSYDSDEPAFHGLRQWNRVSFSGLGYHFKAAAYLHRGNHAQFNSLWGRDDAGPPGSWLLNSAPILPAQDQRRVAAVLVSAFLEASLNGDRSYLELFRDVRRGAAWLSDVAIVSRFQDSRFVPLADFEEDLDLTTGSAPGVRLAGPGLALWREEELRHRDDRLQGSSAAVVGWSREKPGSFDLHFARGTALAEGTRLAFQFGVSTELLAGVAAEAPAPAGLRLELEDARGRRASVAVGEHCGIAPPLRVRLSKLAFLDRARYGADWEPVLQSCEVPLASFQGLDALAPATLRFLFDAATPGVALLDAIGLAR
jgi:dienelactone hydrolase